MNGNVAAADTFDSGRTFTAYGAGRVNFGTGYVAAGSEIAYHLATIPSSLVFGFVDDVSAADLKMKNLFYEKLSKTFLRLIVFV